MYGTPSTLSELVLEKHLFQLRVVWADVSELVIPLVDNSIREPRGTFTRSVNWSFTASHTLIVERNRIVPPSLTSASDVLSELLLASGSSSVVLDECSNRLGGCCATFKAG